MYKVYVKILLTMYKAEKERMTFNKMKYDNDYQKENYDRIILNVKKGEKDKIKEYAKIKGYESMNQYINSLIRQDMNGEGALNKCVIYPQPRFSKCA